MPGSGAPTVPNPAGPPDDVALAACAGLGPNHKGPSPRIMLVGTAEARISVNDDEKDENPNDEDRDAMDDDGWDPSAQPPPTPVADDPMFLEKLERRIRSVSIPPRHAARAGKLCLVLDIDCESKLKGEKKRGRKTGGCRSVALSCCEARSIPRAPPHPVPCSPLQHPPDTLYDLGTPGETATEKARPGLHRFLARAWTRYDIVVWSASGMEYLAQKLLQLGCLQEDHPEGVFKARWAVRRGLWPTGLLAYIYLPPSIHPSVHPSVSPYPSAPPQIHSFMSGRSMVTVGPLPDHNNGALFNCKPLQVLWRHHPRWGPHNTIIIDDLGRNFVSNPDCGLRIKPFRRSRRDSSQMDDELDRIGDYLSLLADEFGGAAPRGDGIGPVPAASEGGEGAATGAGGAALIPGPPASPAPASPVALNPPTPPDPDAHLPIAEGVTLQVLGGHGEWERWTRKRAHRLKRPPIYRWRR